MPNYCVRCEREGDNVNDCYCYLCQMAVEAQEMVYVAQTLLGDLAQANPNSDVATSYINNEIRKWVSVLKESVVQYNEINNKVNLPHLNLTIQGA